MYILETGVSSALHLSLILNYEWHLSPAIALLSVGSAQQGVIIRRGKAASRLTLEQSLPWPIIYQSRTILILALRSGLKSYTFDVTIYQVVAYWGQILSATH
jgi:hypothetical protein